MNTVKKQILYFALLLPILLFSMSAQESNSTATAHNDDSLAVFYAIDGDVQDKYNTLVETKTKRV